MAATPRKKPDEICLTCKRKPERLFNFKGKKICKAPTFQNKFQDFLQLEIKDYDLQYLFICQPCYHKIETFSTFQAAASHHAKSLLAQLQRPKRLPRTPLQSTPKRVSVSSRLIASVEKLKISDAESSTTTTASTEPKTETTASRRKLFPDTKGLSDEISKSVFPLEETDRSRSDLVSIEHLYAASSPQPYRVPSRSDHPYAMPAIPSASTDRADREYTFSSAESLVVKNIDNSEWASHVHNMCQVITEVCSPGKSVLYSKSPRYLSEHDVFSEAVCELHQTCPFLFTILSSALGNRITASSKISTIATIYGMILHCNNNKVSAVQRLFTTTAIRYHADNKVSICSEGILTPFFVFKLQFGMLKGHFQNH